jgi:hypothetical protein
MCNQQIFFVDGTFNYRQKQNFIDSKIEHLNTKTLV